MNRIYLFSLLSLFLLAVSCSNKYHRFVSNYTFSTPAGTPDYSKLDHWAAHPWKKDPSDSVSKPLRESYHPDTSVDVFFIHPTTYIDKQNSLGWNAPIDNAELDAKTDYSTILFQASIFNEAGRVFAPRYRQANYFAYFPKTAEDTLKALAAFELAYQDVKAAFLYYLDHYNKGRAIVIASHSQGTNHAERLLKELFDGTQLQKKLVVAYLAGMPLEPGYFHSIKSCDSPSQTGCACSWRTFREGYKPDYVQHENFTAIVTNPLTWDAAKPVADRWQNKGGMLLNFNKLIKGLTNANLGNGVLWTEKPHFFGNFLFTTKNYHISDLNFFYLNVRDNVQQRVTAFIKK
jgi:hypothetical protein